MKRLIIAALILLLCSPVFAWQIPAKDVSLDTDEFGTNLSSDDYTVQRMAETLDELSISSVSDTAYDSGTWDAVTTIAPSKNAVRDKIESLAGGHDAVTITCPDANVTAGQAITFSDVGPIVITEATDTITFTVTEADPTVDTSAEIMAIIGANGISDSHVSDTLTSSTCTGTAAVATAVTITDNEATAENNPIVFVAGADPDGGNLGLETDGTCYYTPSTGVITTTGFAGALTGNVTGNTSGSSGSCTGNSATVTNATLTTALTVDTGTVGLTGNVANTSVLTLGAGASSISGANTGDSSGHSALAPLDSPVFTTALTVPVGLTGVLRADTGVMSVDTDVTDLVTAASTSAQGKIEIATSAETTTGTDATRAVSPDGLAGSDYGKRVIQIKVIDDATALTTGDGKTIFVISSELNGYNLMDADAMVSTVSSSGTPTYQIRNVTDSQDMLSTLITIDANENTSYTAETPPVINGTYDDVATGDILAVDKDVAGTGEKGDTLILTFQLP